MGEGTAARSTTCYKGRPGAIGNFDIYGGEIRVLGCRVNKAMSPTLVIVVPGYLSAVIDTKSICSICRWIVNIDECPVCFCVEAMYNVTGPGIINLSFGHCRLFR